MQLVTELSAFYNTNLWMPFLSGTPLSAKRIRNIPLISICCWGLYHICFYVTPTLCSLPPHEAFSCLCPNVTAYLRRFV